MSKIWPRRRQTLLRSGMRSRPLPGSLLPMGQAASPAAKRQLGERAESFFANG